LRSLPRPRHSAGSPSRSSCYDFSIFRMLGSGEAAPEYCEGRVGGGEHLNQERRQPPLSQHTIIILTSSRFL
jgi:hypothetical protein